MAIRTALIGYGIGGSVFHEPFLAVDPSYEIAAVVTSSPQRRAKAQQRYRVIPTVDELWSRADEFDLAIITSPTAMHTEHALAALDAGLHVVVDKPIAITSADARRIVERAHARGKSLSTFQSRRYDAEHQTARELISSGVLGDMVRLELNFLRDVGGLRHNWRDRTATNDGGGVTFDLGSHMFDAAQYLLGPATSITGTTRWLRGGDADDDLDAVLTHQSGAVSQIRCSWVTAQTLPWLHLVGTKASYTVNDTDVQEPKLKAGQRPTAAKGFGRVAKSDWGRLTRPNGTWTPTPTVDGDYGAFYRGLARHLEHGEPVPVDPHDAVHTLELIESFLSTQGSAIRKGASMFELSASVSMVLPELPLVERVKLLHDTGLGIGLWDPTDAAVDAVLATGAKATIMDGFGAGNIVHPGAAEQMLASAEALIPIAKKLGSPLMNLHGAKLTSEGPAAVPVTEVSDAMRATAHETLARFAELGAAHDVVFGLENLNPIDHPGVPLASGADVIALIRGINSAHLRVNFDVYHAARGGEDVTALLAEVTDIAAEIQLADSPTRHWPGEHRIDFGAIAAQLTAAGYRGSVALEAWILRDADNALNEFLTLFGKDLK